MILRSDFLHKGGDCYYTIYGSWHIYDVFNNEAHYREWTAWICVGVRVKVRVDLILQNRVPPLYVPGTPFTALMLCALL